VSATTASATMKPIMLMIEMTSALMSMEGLLATAP
jgi:hypothetical protein